MVTKVVAHGARSPVSQKTIGKWAKLSPSMATSSAVLMAMVVVDGSLKSLALAWGNRLGLWSMVSGRRLAKKWLKSDRSTSIVGEVVSCNRGHDRGQVGS